MHVTRVVPTRAVCKGCKRTVQHAQDMGDPTICWIPPCPRCLKRARRITRTVLRFQNVEHEDPAEQLKYLRKYRRVLVKMARGR